MNNPECVKIKEALKKLITSWEDPNRYSFSKWIQENSKQPIDNNPVVWNLKGKPNKNE